MLKGYTYRLHSTPAQAEFLVRTIAAPDSSTTMDGF
ncbi:helix-turn-helix domain-containing protein [Exiguobacterium sp. s83]|nr:MULTISPECIES: helix-turn-helix domain-containing protein [unclassified Exiguobacterium]